jgi:two-component system chemotaxis response regulator CheB
VREAGGQVVVQDEATSVVWGMPGYVANAGLADAVVPLGQVASEVWRRIGGIRKAPSDILRLPGRSSCP